MEKPQQLLGMEFGFVYLVKTGGLKMQEVDEDYICELCKKKARDCDCGNIKPNPDMID